MNVFIKEVSQPLYLFEPTQRVRGEKKSALVAGCFGHTSLMHN